MENHNIFKISCCVISAAAILRPLLVLYQATPKGQKGATLKINGSAFLDINKGIHYSEERTKSSLIFRFLPITKGCVVFLSVRNYIILICLHSEPMGDYKEAFLMTEKTLKPVYDPAEVEDRLYQTWLDNNYFYAHRDPNKETFTIVIPPPNVTGSLHMGHALDNTIQDILIRRKRMQGYDTLWLPGTDHAGIATQIKVEEHLSKEGLTRHDLGREKFLERTWQWIEKYHARGIKQLYKLGVSCDWSRERFTMDEGCSRAVREVLFPCMKKGLLSWHYIY